MADYYTLNLNKRVSAPMPTKLSRSYVEVQSHNFPFTVRFFSCKFPRFPLQGKEGHDGGVGFFNVLTSDRVKN